MQTSFHKKYEQLLCQKYPSAVLALRASPYPVPVSSVVISLPKAVVKQMEKFVKILYKVAHAKTHQDVVYTPSSLLMSYDFHWNDQEGLKLIEINTGASGYLVSELINHVHQQKTSALISLEQSFQQEWLHFVQFSADLPSLSISNFTPPPHCLIVDHHIEQQKLWIEFLMFKDLLHQWGWSCQLHEIGDITMNQNNKLVDREQKEISMIYNRNVDFYFDNYPLIKQAIVDKTCCVSPHFVEYSLMADKQRLCEWSSEDFFDSLSIDISDQQMIQQVLPRAGRVHTIPSEQLWKERHQLFFKPLRGYGGKSVYKGKSMTRKTFTRIINESGIYQQFIPPATLTDDQGKQWKYDLRAYVYKDRIQHLVGRVYQGQVTTFRTPNSGFAAVVIQ